MKKFLLSFLFGAFMMVSAISFAQTGSETITFKVNGLEACKSSIENVLNGVHGISSVAWDATTKKATVTYNPADIKVDLIYVYFAEKGFDTERLRAKQKNYEALPEECKYQRDPERD